MVHRPESNYFLLIRWLTKTINVCFLAATLPQLLSNLKQKRVDIEKEGVMGAEIQEEFETKEIADDMDGSEGRRSRLFTITHGMDRKSKWEMSGLRLPINECYGSFFINPNGR